MPPGASAALLDELAGWSVVKPAPSMAKIVVSFVDMNCDEGFNCISQVEKFGLNHDGKYSGLPIANQVPPELKGTYEMGCPARGLMSSSGECIYRQTGSRIASDKCWSMDRFEAGANSPCKNVDDCLCVKKTHNGNPTLNNKYATIKQGGKEVISQKYMVQPKEQCDKCGDHDCAPALCNKCQDCEYTTKTVGGRRSEGCYDRAAKKPDHSGVSETGRPYLDGDEAAETDFMVIPHYPIWDPGATRGVKDPGYDAAEPSRILRFPYQSRGEALSKEGWIAKYTEAAPWMQRMLDVTRDKFVADMAEPTTVDCDSDLPGRRAKMLSQRRACKVMQTIVNKLGSDVEFEDETLDLNGKSNKIRCKMGEGTKCIGLDCYFSDKDLNSSLSDLYKRQAVCKIERAEMERAGAEAEPGGKAGTSADTKASGMPWIAALMLSAPPTSDHRKRPRAELGDFL